MKIDQESKAFTPVTITIESEKELLALWMHLNTPTADVMRYASKGIEIVRAYESVSMRMFRMINDCVINNFSNGMKGFSAFTELKKRANL